MFKKALNSDENHIYKKIEKIFLKKTESGCNILYLATLFIDFKSEFQ